jgi:hypothetical protein
MLAGSYITAIVTASLCAVLILLVLSKGRLLRWWTRIRHTIQAAIERDEMLEEREQRAHEAARHECTFWFVSAAHLRESTDKCLPSFQQLSKRGHGWLSKHTIARDGSFRGAYAQRYLAVSHRWFARDAPDKDGLQLAEIRIYLEAHPEVQWVWYDYWCMPQGDRTPAQKVAFNYMLQNVNYLYLGCSVLILLDLSYLSRFWTQFEAWLSFQVPSPDGLLGPKADLWRSEAEFITGQSGRSKTRDVTRRNRAWTRGSSPSMANVNTKADSSRCTVAPIYNANSAICACLQAMWAEKTPAEAHEILAKEDVTVTSLKDKDMHLPKILTLNDEIISVLSGAPPTNSDHEKSDKRLQWAPSINVSAEELSA